MAKLSVSCVHANFSHSYSGIFSFRIFCLFKCPLKLSKRYLLLFGNNSVKVWTLFDMSSKYVNTVGSNSLKVSMLCDMNSEKSSYYSLIWKEFSENASIVWYELWKSVWYCLPVTLWKCQYCLMFRKVCTIVWE